MDSNESTEKINKEAEFELEKVKLRQIELEKELKRIKEEATPVEPKAHNSLPPLLFICLTFLPPVGIIMLWIRKEHIIIKILLTLYSLFMLALLTGLISFNLWPGFIFFAF